MNDQHPRSPVLPIAILASAIILLLMAWQGVSGWYTPLSLLPALAACFWPTGKRHNSAISADTHSKDSTTQLAQELSHATSKNALTAAGVSHAS